MHLQNITVAKKCEVVVDFLCFSFSFSWKTLQFSSSTSLTMNKKKKKRFVKNNNKKL